MSDLAEIEDGMTRGGRKKVREAPERRCIATGSSGQTERMIRFVLSPEGFAVPDLAAKLPGRGAWLTAERSLVERAVKKNLFSRAFRQPVKTDPDLPDLLKRLLAQRLIDTISMARRAGAAVTGAEKVRARISSGDAAVLVQAYDGAADGVAEIRKLAAAAGNGAINRIALLSAAELGLAFGRDFAIHATLDAGGFADRACAEAGRLSGLRDGNVPGGKTDERIRGQAGSDPEAKTIDNVKGFIGDPMEQDDP